jgi:hypothetical protein
MKFDKNLYTGLIRHPLLMVNKKVGENYSLIKIRQKPYCILHLPLYQQGIICAGTLKIELEARPMSLTFLSALRKLNAGWRELLADQ